jgi:hypothetical protein
MDKSMLRDTIFEINYYGNGGNRRAAQLDELIRSEDFEIVDIVKKYSSHAGRRQDRYIDEINAVIKGTRFFLKNRVKIYPDYELIKRCGYLYQSYWNQFTKHKGQQIFLWESTRNEYYIAPYIAKEANFKVIATPHNIESLYFGLDPFTKQSLPHSLENEFKHLAVADAVFCIAREEQWLLNFFGIDAEFLPYYPPQPILANLWQIRKLREQSNRHLKQENRFLILGTAENESTKIGMIELANNLKEIRKQIDFRVDLAGYRTEEIQAYCDGVEFITFHGTVDQNLLNKILVDTTAILIFQKKGVGALTKIPEMLIAGIPVIANGNACRSAFGYSGVYCYDNEEELAELMSIKLEQPAIIPRPKEAEKRFIDCLKKLQNR